MNPALVGVNVRDVEDCEACHDLEDWPCAFHTGQMTGEPPEVIPPISLPPMRCSMCSQRFWTTARTDSGFYRDCPVMGCAGYMLDEPDGA